VNNVNLLWFEDTAVLEQFVFQSGIETFIGTDVSMGFEYRPLLNNNVIVLLGLSALFPGAGFRDLYSSRNGDIDPFIAGFVEIQLTY
jgi:hypothetical protein